MEVCVMKNKTTKEQLYKVSLNCGMPSAVLSGQGLGLCSYHSDDFKILEVSALCGEQLLGYEVGLVFWQALEEAEWLLAGG